MIYNPVLNLSRDEIIVKVLMDIVTAQNDNGIVYNDETIYHEILRGKLMQNGVTNSTPKQIRDIWLFRHGWLYPSKFS